MDGGKFSVPGCGSRRRGTAKNGGILQERSGSEEEIQNLPSFYSFKAKRDNCNGAMVNGEEALSGRDNGEGSSRCGGVRACFQNSIEIRSLFS